MLIDFGLSILVDRLEDPKYFNNTFASYMPQWFWYPVDIHVLSFCAKYGTLTYEGLHQLLDLCLNNPIFDAYSLRHRYREQCLEVFLPLVGTDGKALISFWSTWDYYDIALRFLYLTQKKQIPEFSPILFSMIHPDPSKRPSSVELRSKNQQMIHSMDMLRLSKIDSLIKESG
jgi:hypothetical protein